MTKKAMIETIQDLTYSRLQLLKIYEESSAPDEKMTEQYTAQWFALDSLCRELGIKY